MAPRDCCTKAATTHGAYEWTSLWKTSHKNASACTIFTRDSTGWRTKSIDITLNGAFFKTQPNARLRIPHFHRNYHTRILYIVRWNDMVVVIWYFLIFRNFSNYYLSLSFDEYSFHIPRMIHMFYFIWRQLMSRSIWSKKKISDIVR